MHNLRKKQSAALKSLTIIGYLEGTSFLLLLCIAMPLKYMLDIPEGVKYIGMAHGILFLCTRQKCSKSQRSWTRRQITY
ncbi:TPA: DUF3817 domain-containing protein [Staphylococcus aureus]|nr:DUF3817 domain-containing protein [Staphylococcus aureus]